MSADPRSALPLSTAAFAILLALADGERGCELRGGTRSILRLLDSPTRGTFRFDGEHVETLSGAQRALLRNREIGFIFQNFNLIGDLTVAENVGLPLV